MVEPSKLEKKKEQEKDNFKKEHQTALGIVFQLVRYVPQTHSRLSRVLARRSAHTCCGGSLWILGSFIKNQDWLSAIITFPIMVIMVAWTAYSKGFLLQIQKRAESLIQQVRTCLPRSTRERGIQGLRNAAGSGQPGDAPGFRPLEINSSPTGYRFAYHSPLLVSSVQKLDFFNFRTANRNAETADLSGVDLSGVDLSGVDLSGADLKYANLRYADLSGANLNRANLRYADLSGADLRYTNLSGANLKYANLSDANLNCTLLRGANLSDANLSRALLFFINLREVLNLEPLQLKAKPSPFLCNVALPSYSQQPELNPNRACGRIPQIWRDRYNISLEEAQWIVDEALQHQWD